MKTWYRIEGFCPPTLSEGETHMGKWGFVIQLTPEFVRDAMAVDMTDYTYQRMQELTQDKLDIIWDSPLFTQSPLRFHAQNEERGAKLTTLLTNISVPGNACGLDMEWDKLSMVERAIEKSEPFKDFMRIPLIPHNVDCQLQQYSLLVAFMVYAHYVPSLLGDDYR